MDKHKGHRGQKKREKWAREHPNMTRTEFARIKRQKRLKKREEKQLKRKEQI